MVDDYDFVQGTLGITGVLATPLVRKQFSLSVTVRYCVEIVKHMPELFHRLHLIDPLF